MSRTEAGSNRPSTIYDVARRAGVSHQTVSRFLRGVAGIRPETKAKVEQALRDLDYRANVAARNLRNGRTGMIALSIPSLNQPYFAELAQSVIQEAREAGLSVFVETTNNDRDRELAVLSQFRGQVLDGAIFAPTLLTTEDLAAETIDFPLVLLGDRIFDSGYDHIAMSNSAGAKAAVEHLISNGRRRIAALGIEGPGREGAAALRFGGYLDALTEAGIPFDPDIAVGGEEWVKSAGVAATTSLIALGKSFDAIFAFNDALALGALRSLALAGIRVPEDVAVVGFDDTEDGLYSTPSLSSIAPGRPEIARRAVERMMVRLNDSSKVQPEEITVGFELKVRESSS